jgi:zinc/manganese transport system substrate-binding protein
MAIASSLVVGLGSCISQPNYTSTSPTPATSEKLQVVTTFLPITQFTKAVAGDRAQVTQLLPGNVGPHEYQAKPEDVLKISKASVLIENGLGMEEFLDNLVKNAGNAKLKLIDSSQGIKTITNELETEHKHKEDRKKAADEREHGEFNPHIWLDPKRVIQQVVNIRDGLIAADPAGKEIYAANAAAYIGKLQQLDAEFTQTLKPYTGKTFVTYHDFAAYFAQSYNLKVQFLVGIPEENASPEDVQRVIKAAKQSNLKILLTEPQAAGNPFAALAKDLKIQVSNFDPLETGNSESGSSDYYFTVMRQNLSNLKNAFGSQSTQSLLLMSSQNSTVAFIVQLTGNFSF